MLDYKKIIGFIAGGVLGFFALAFGIFGIIKLVSSNNSAEVSNGSSASNVSQSSTPTEISLQLAVNKWVDSEGESENSGIVAYDIDNSAVVARHNEDKTFDMAQLYQLFIAYEGYYRLSRDWEGDVGYPELGENRATCLERMLRWSDVGCSDAMWDEIGRDTLDSIYKTKGFSSTKIATFTSTAADLLTLMQLYYNHPQLSDAIWGDIRETLLNQDGNPTFDGQNLRQGLPSGFTVATVYNKAGWYWTGSSADPVWHTYNDAAFVDFPETQDRNGELVPARHYIVVVLTHETAPSKIVTLGRNIESAVRTADNY